MKYMLIIPLMVILMTGLVTAEAVILSGPRDNWTTTSTSVEFAYSFDSPMEIDNCTLYVNGEKEAYRNDLFMFQNNKMRAELSPASYLWSITCYNEAGTEMKSAERTLTVTGDVEVKEGYETIYNNNGLRSYEITPAPGQAPIDLPGIKSGEEFQIRTSARTYYFDILKMGVATNSSFIEFRDRNANKVVRIVENETYIFSPQQESTLQVNVKLNRVERRVNAYLTLTPYPDSVIVEEPPVEQNTTTEEPVVQPPVVNEEPIEEPQTPPATQPSVVETEVTNSSNWGIVLALIAIVVIAIAIAAYTMGKKKETHIDFKRK